MQILATISDMRRIALIVDLETRATTAIPVRSNFLDPVLEAPCRPFGITWSETEVYIANNLQLLVYDKQWRYLRTMETPLQVNTHQLAFHASNVWAVSPRTNSLIGVPTISNLEAFEFDLCGHKLVTRSLHRASEAGDRHHFNSLLWTDDALFVAAHNFGQPSFINRYHASTLRLEHVYQNAGSSIHGLALHGEELFWISTRTDEIRSSLGYILPLSRRGYARGFAMTESYFIVAISDFLRRDERRGGNSWIQILDRRDGLVVDEFHLCDTGSINDLRLLDAYDYGHRVEPLLGAGCACHHR